MYVSINGAIQSRSSAKVSAVSDGLFYGAGCFETLKSYGSRFLHFRNHISRLNGGIQYLTGSNLHQLDAALLKSEIKKLLEANSLSHEPAKVRIQVSLQSQSTYDLPSDIELTTVITVSGVSSSSGVTPRSLKTSAITVVPVSCKPARYKLSNMLHYRQAAINAKESGFDDALMLTVDGIVAETSIANLFWEHEGTIFTPSYSCDILPGVTRDVFIEVCKKMNVTVKQGEFRRKDIMESRQVWVTNSMLEICEVSTIDQHSFETGTHLSEQIMDRFEEYKSRHLS